VIDQSLFGVEKLSKYILYIQREFNPELSEAASQIFTNYYQFLRKRERLPKDRKTIRMLESLIRISEAHARLMMRKEIIVLDAIMTIILMEHCLNSGLLEELYPVIMSFERYQEAKHEILLRLGLNPGNFLDPVMKRKTGRRKKNKKLDDYNPDTYIMSERSEFTGFESSQDERSVAGFGGNNFYIDSSQNSTHSAKKFVNSQSSLSFSQNKSSSSQIGELDFLGDSNANESSCRDEEMEDVNRPGKQNDDDLIDITALM
jgi:hypothetical protein